LTTIGPWIGFHVLVLVIMATDLSVGRHKHGVLTLRTAAGLTALWVTVAVCFGAFVALHFGRESGLEFLGGYLLEESLSVDNLFVFTVVFTSFGIPLERQRRVLFWGILGALVLRGIMIAGGVYMVERFEWILFVFGGLLVITGLKLFRDRNHPTRPEASRLIPLVQRLVPVTSRRDGDKFFIREEDSSGRRRLMATPFFAALLAIEATDIVFAIDSIPAVFAVTRDPFIVYTSNILAVLGLRSLYFLVLHGLKKFRYLNVGVAVLLVFIGAKMLLNDWIHIPVTASLAVIATILSSMILLSIAKGPALPAPGDTGEYPVGGAGPPPPGDGT
jgi:tellurite resistance protein TerC